MQLPVTVVSPGWKWPIRLRDVIGRFLVGMLLLWIVFSLWSMKEGVLRRVPDFVLGVVTVGILYAVLIVSSDPLAGNLGIVQIGYRAAIWLGVVFGSAFLGDRMKDLLQNRKPSAAPPATDTSPASPATST